MTILASTASGEQSAWVWLAMLGVLVAIAAVFYWLDRWDKKKGGSHHSIITRAGGAMFELQTLLEPSKRHVIEVQQKQLKKDAGAGDDDDTSAYDVP